MSNSCNLRNMDERLMKAVKVAAFLKGQTLKEYVVELLKEAVNGGDPRKARAAKG